MVSRNPQNGSIKTADGFLDIIANQRRECRWLVSNMANPVDLLITEDSTRYPGYKMPLWHNPQEDFSPERGFGSRFRMILVENGSGILRVHGRQGGFIAPVLLCLNETERLERIQGRDLQAQALYFHPSVVNNVFDFEMIRGGGQDLALSESQDLDWFVPFTRRSPGTFKLDNLGPASARRISELMKTIGNLTSTLGDANWPCRSRSYFLELLFVVERIFNIPEAVEASSLAGDLQGMDDVILYLHTHYNRKISLADLTRVFHTNRTTLTQKFHQATGLSVVAYLTRLRMNVASLILRDTELDINQIMRRVGFQDNTHFGRTFRRYNGCTPSEYREKYCWMLHPGASTPSNGDTPIAH
jgi:AraC-like DNA-binding protein